MLWWYVWLKSLRLWWQWWVWTLRCGFEWVRWLWWVFWLIWWLKWIFTWIGQLNGIFRWVWMNVMASVLYCGWFLDHQTVLSQCHILVVRFWQIHIGCWMGKCCYVHLIVINCLFEEDYWFVVTYMGLCGGMNFHF